ncbi:MAG: sugar phosphate isomerase/epimerase [Lachnospiraceae bacterium]|nr:sugar phosphate isomerase/epimerase [Lachnospiraceae bacterium]
MEIGAQLFTVREFCRTLTDFAETLKKVADIGYRTVQVSATCPFEAEWLKRELEANGLRCVLTHTPKDRLLQETDKVAEEHAVFGCDYVGLGMFKFEDPVPDYITFKTTWGPVAERLKQDGRYFMYHNHAREFQKIGRETILEKIIEDFPADVMGITLDTYWAQVGGADPAQYLEKLKGRIPCIHLKDCGYGSRMEVIGEGNINFDRVFEKAEAGGTKYMLVEQDNCNGEDPFECLKRSYEYLRSYGFR